jgi:uncharacterized protein YggT (Ycf19 family)
LGKIAMWPWSIQLLVPVFVVMVLWLGFYPALTKLNVLSPAQSIMHVLEQGSLIGLGLFMTLKYLLPPLLLLHLIGSYVYLGKSSFWNFVATTAQHLTGPLRRLPLQFAKLDFAPVVGAVLILGALQWLPNMILNKLTASNVNPWPL